MAVGRRQFLSLLTGAVVLGPRASLAQAAKGTPTVGFLLGIANDAEAQGRIKVFEEQLRREGWNPGQDIRIEYRFAAGDTQRMRAMASELVALEPAVIVGHSTPVVTALVQATRSVPIVFVVVADPVGSGFASSIARPGGNVTGFTNLDPTITGKLFATLRELKGDLDHVRLMFNPDTATSGGLFQSYVDAFEAAAKSFRIGAAVAHVRNPEDVERTLAELGKSGRAGLVVMPDNFTAVHRKLIVAQAEKWRVPAIYPYRYFVEDGGLISYGVDVRDLFRRAPQYVGRILRGAAPGDLPVQAPTKFELVINLKTAAALGLKVPKILLTSADSLIE